MKVVTGLENEELNKEPNDKQSGFVHMKKFHFIMLLFFVVFLSAGITTFALAFGDEKAVPVISERNEFDKLYTAFDTITKGYYKEVDENKLVNGAINGMIESLDDPYSDYMNEDEAASFHQSISSSFEGIGAEIQERDGFIVIVSPLKGSPAEKAGIKPEDKVLTVDGKSIQGMSSTEAVMLIRGEKGTKVELEIERPGTESPLKITVVRDTIPLETVYGEMIDEGIAKIQITSFSENTSKELIEKLNELQNQGMKGLVLDLRQNPGGLLDQAIAISSLFVPEGDILFQIEDRDGNVEKVNSNNKDNPSLPLVVVIDKGSASASEILAAAVSESANVPLVGEKSFGKGTVQRAQDFEDGSNIKFTTEKWLTPKGNWIHEKGITPNYEVALPDYSTLTLVNPEEEFKLSSSSTEVKSAQGMLKALGYDPGRVDGFFDEKTEQAVIKFQKAEKLEANGILKGETTLKLMEKLRELINNNDTQIQKAVEVLKEQIKS
ncbi:S41 family peptidase [Robertmurraya kyonggiensis]|uniref:C-terminal processing peptidase n=1 Tax=Robertmurraya kyonggiensis TaxID=1037680 RepID=A0A4U1DBX1_9BACI|nr:S41 family peptidase [Robertmurraya kyonggiensis]TKC19573.1 PDZ domain-containing protein [Robertmurraya kyonggiensis]